ncbi:hypothetical protein LTR17_006246 [Elasticomyces elasticus]|nr:hypothetical protein LTR17_006246 [Elasticomyces elasticus]
MKLTLISFVSMAATLATALPKVDAVSKTTKVSIADFGTYNSSTLHENIHANIAQVNTTTHAFKIFCDRSVGIPLSPGLAGGYRGAYAYIDYYDNPVSAPTGQVYMSVYVRWDEGCEALQYLSYVSCIANLEAAIVKCDTSGDDIKHGGYTDYQCLEYMISPNSKDCYIPQGLESD